METSELIQEVIDIFEDHKAVDLVVFDVRKKSTIADYYVFCSGNSDVHLRALSNSLGKALKDKHQILPKSVEGSPASRWILMDFADVLIHIFHPEVRKRYAIENLHKDAPVIYPEDGWEFPEAIEEDGDPYGLKEKIPAFLR